METPIFTQNECVTVRDDNGRFLPGTIPPGRPKGRVGGRAMALQTLDAMLGEERNQENLRHALQANFDNDPVKFFGKSRILFRKRHAKHHLTQVAS